MSMYEGELGPIEIEVEDEDITRAHRILQKEIGKEGIIDKMKDSLRYTSPSEERHRKRQQREREED